MTTDEFIALAESISGQDLGALFETWLFTAGKPAMSTEAAAAAAAAARTGTLRDVRHAPAVVRSQVERYGKDSSAATAH